ncbi:hypothetical protein OL548_25785 [Lysinibacillus sp. MHQ-1]|nr:hypothetical protein OL548_25785 [Lysinibacillus sp. MHQ-1]
MKFDLSGIPGVTASMDLYLKEDFNLIPPEEVKQAKKRGKRRRRSLPNSKLLRCS